MTPRVVGRYQLLELLGQGGMGTVYLAFDPALERQVALKLLTLPGGSERRRFRREVQVAARLSHRHIVTIHDVGLEHDPPYVVMELLTGGTLETYLKDHRLHWREALTLLQPLCQALAHAHQAGIIHRDIKPANILFTGGAESTLKLADFGLARRQGSEQLTQGGAVMGTLGYMSPEQATGQDVTTASDVFAVGIILFEAITGFNPVRGQSWSETLANISSPDPIDLTPLEGKAPAQVITFISKAICKDRHRRYGDARFLEQEITQILHQVGQEEIEPIPVDLVLPGEELHIDNAAALSLPAGGTEILRLMFAGYGRVTVKDELLGGRSGSRIFLVRPIRHDGTPELPTVVKMAPIYLIQQEWRAYQDYVRAQLAGVAEIQGQPILPPGSSWGGLRYPLVGGGDFAIESLYRYCQEASPADIRYLLERRLFRRMGEKWRHNFAVAEFRLGDSYDAILPVNLLVQPTSLPSEATAVLLQPGVPGSPQVGNYLLVTEFVVSEVDEASHSVTLNRPTSSQPRFYPSYRLRLQPVADLSQYKAGQWVDLEGVVTATRQELLLAQAQMALGEGFDVAAANLPNGWPNPLHRLSFLLAETMNVRTANIHGDFNLDNILVDPATREVYLIDFALARRDHVLHDLLRLEKDVMTRLLPESLLTAGLPVQALDQFYRWVDAALAQERPSTLPEIPHPALEKPLLIVYLIRRAARDLLFDPQRWAEYEAGLTLYLLGALKFKDLTVHARQVAFWGAAALQHRLHQPIITHTSLPQLSIPTSPRPARRFPALLLTGLLLFILAFIIWRISLQPEPAAPQIATILSFTEPVEVRRFETNQLQPVSFGLPLYDGDVVITYGGGAAIVYCANGLLFERPNNSLLAVHCQGTDAESVFIAPVPEPTEAPEGEATPLPPLTQNPFLLTPRNTAIISTRPTFAWEAIPQTDFYRLSVRFADGSSWLRETSETSLAYPLEEQSLTPGSVHVITLEAVGAETVMDVTELRVLDDASATTVATGEADIRQKGLDEAAETYLLALLYAQNGLTAEAIRLLETLTSTSAPTSPYLWQQLGDLYDKVGLSRQAQASYALVETVAAAENILPATATPRPTSTPTLLPTNTATPMPAPVVTLPAAPGTPYPQPVNPIDPTNAAQIVALAQWGDRPLSEVTCSPDGQTIAVGVADGVNLYTLSNLAEKRFLPVGVFVNSLAFSPDGQLLATGSADGAIRLWQLSDWEQVEEVREHTAGVWNIAFSSDGQRLASGSLDGTVRLWRVEGKSLQEQITLPGHEGPVRSVVFAPDGQYLASAGDDDSIRLWQVNDGTQIRIMAEHTDIVRSVAFSPDGQLLASGSDDGTIRLWQVDDGSQLKILQGHNRTVQSVAFSPDGHTLASGGQDTNIRLWQVSNWLQLYILEEPAGWVFGVTFCDEGRFLVTGSADGTLYLWGILP